MRVLDRWKAEAVKKAAEKLEALRARSGAPLPAQTMAQLRRLMKRLSVVSEQIAEIDAARVAEVAAPDPDRGTGMIRLLVAICGMGLETATRLVSLVRCSAGRSAIGVGSRRSSA